MSLLPACLAADLGVFAGGMLYKIYVTVDSSKVFTESVRGARMREEDVAVGGRRTCDAPGLELRGSHDHHTVPTLTYVTVVTSPFRHPVTSIPVRLDRVCPRVALKEMSIFHPRSSEDSRTRSESLCSSDTNPDVKCAITSVYLNLSSDAIDSLQNTTYPSQEVLLSEIAC